MGSVVDQGVLYWLGARHQKNFSFAPPSPRAQCDLYLVLSGVTIPRSPLIAARSGARPMTISEHAVGLVDPCLRCHDHTGRASLCTFELSGIRLEPCVGKNPPPMTEPDGARLPVSEIFLVIDVPAIRAGHSSHANTISCNTFHWVAHTAGPFHIEYPYRSAYLQTILGRQHLTQRRRRGMNYPIFCGFSWNSVYLLCLQSTIANNVVAIFSKSTCSYCSRTKHIFRSQFPDVRTAVVE